ncbi:hypothetical protein [Rhizobium sp.]|uniref:hypothetical protein n=1 Tax=Rhizobium sp. TaxID=391 RepID=UPI0028AF829B
MLRTLSAIAATVLGVIAGSAATSLADTKKGNAVTAASPVIESADTTVAKIMPPGYAEIAQRRVTVDGEGAQLVRYERADRRNADLGGEHFSVIVADDGRLKGFTRMDLDLVGGRLPSREDTQKIAMDFLRTAAPDLLPGMKISWIEPHDEPLRATRNENFTLTGMKVKMRNGADGRWMWVIVGADRKVMVFERDIVWVTFPGHRKTEKWLHDSWLVEQGHKVRPS